MTNDLKHENGHSAGMFLNGSPDDFPPELRAQASAALELEKQSLDKAIDAWKKLVAGAPNEWAPRRELARVYKKAERWKNYVEVLTEGVDKASWPSQEAKLPLLWEMIEVYRDRLKLDVKVIQHFNQILTIQPANLEAVDALASQFEAMKRWPDLISILRKKVGVVEDPAEKVALNLRIANLYLEKFSNQAEAIKAFEAVLEIDPANGEALAYLKQMYEKRRDWDKLVAISGEEIARLTDPAERRRKRIEVAKLASEKLKKPSVSIALWKQVMSEPGADGDSAEALAELEKLYEREKQWPELGAVLEKQVALAQDAAGKSPLLVKLALLYTEKVQDAGKAIAAWQSLLAVEPDNRRAQDALKKLYLTAKDWNALESFYASQGKWDEFVRVLERQSEVEDDAGRVGLWVKVAELYRDRLQKPDRAQKAYEKVLSLDANNLAAAQALVPFYEKANDGARLAAVYKVELAHTADPALRAERMQRIVELLDGANDKAAAATVALQAFSENPGATWSREAAERLAGEVGNWQDLAAEYEKALEKVGAGKASLPLLKTLARAYERELADHETAIARNRAILKLAAEDEEAVLALERLYVATGRFEELLAIYDKKIALAKTSEEKREVSFKLASLYEDEIKDPAKAIEVYQGLLKDAPKDVAALRALDRLYATTGAWKKLAATIEQELALAGDARDAAELRFRLGGLREQHLGDAPGAVAAYREALSLDAAHEGARGALEAYLGNADLQMDAVAALEPIYEKAEDLGRMVQVQRIKLQRQTETKARVALLLRIGALESALGRMPEAFDAYAQAFTEAPSSTEARAALEELADHLDRWPQVVQLYAGALEPSGAGKKKVEGALERELLTVMAVAFDEKLGEPEKAVELFRRAQDITPDDPSALDALERLYTRTERWNDLVETLKKKAELTKDADAREQIQVRVATLWEEMIGDVDEAIAAWKEVVSENPASVPALRSLDRLYAAKGADKPLAANLERQLELAEARGAGPDETAPLLSRLGALREKLRDLGGAVEMHRRLLELAPGHDETIAALERILPDPAHELALAELLEPVYRSRSDFRSLIRVHEIQVKHAQDARRRVELLHEIATAYEDGCDDPENAYEALGRALAEDPLDEETNRRIERLARGLTRFEDLVARFGRIVGTVSDASVQRAVYHRMADLSERELQRDDWAAEAYLRALDVAPKDLVAANALEQIYVRASDYANLVSLLRRKIDIVDDVAEKKELGFKAAQVYEEVLEQPEQAVEVYRQILAADDSDPSALDNLERLYVRLERWAELKNVYARKADLAASPQDKKSMLFVLGQVYDRELRDAEKAIETYNSIIDIDPEDFEAAQALDRLYAQTERWYDLLAILEKQTQLAPSAAEAVSLRFRIGQLWHDKLKDMARAVEAYRQVLTMDPAHEQTIAALEAMTGAGEEPILAAQALEPIFESAGEWEKVVGVYEVMVRHTADAARKLELLAKIAELQERRLSNWDAAFEAYGRALQVDPTSPDVVAHLDRLAEATGRWADVAALYEAQMERVVDPAQQVEMLLRVGRIYEDETGETDKAIAAYKRVSQLDPERKDGLVALDRLYTKTQSWQDLAEVLRREIRLAPAEEEIITLNFRLAQILELALGDLPRAIEAYQEILTADPAHPDTRAALERMLQAGTMQAEIAQILEPLYRLGEEWEKLVEIYSLELARLTAPEERVNLLRRLADIAENKLFDQVAAFEHWGRAVLEDASSEMALDEYLRLVRATHQWEGFVATMYEAGTKHPDPAVRRDVLLRLAASYENDMRDLARAEEVLLMVLEAHPQEPTALAALDRIYDAQGTFDQLAEVLRRRIAITDDTRELVTLNLRLGRVLADVIDDVEGAIAAYLAVLEHESRNNEALDALERLYFRTERWQELYGVYERMIDVAPGDAVLADCYARMATITAKVFDQRDKAIELWRRVLDLRGPDPVSLASLADLYEAAGEWRELTEVLDNQIRATDDPALQIPMYKRLGRIWGERLARERNSLECWQKVLELDPTDVEALKAIAANYKTAGAWEELSDTLRRLIDIGVVDGESHGISQAELKELYAQLGELEGTTLMRTQEAIDAWRRVLDLDATDFRALAALETLLTQEGRWEECVEVLERRAQALATPEEQVDVLMQAASIWADKIGDSGSAADVYERVLQIDPSNQPASMELEQIYRNRKSWMQLVELLLNRTAYLGTQEKIAVFVQIAETYEQHLGDRESAFITLQAAFREDYSNDHVAKELERLATVAGKWNELIGEYTQLVQGIEDPKQAADLWVKIGRWYDSALNHVEYAIVSVEQALKLDANNAGAFAALTDFYRKLGQHDKLAWALGRHAEVEEDVTRKVELLLQLAAVYETQLGDTAQAIAAYEQALANDDRSLAAIDALERLYRRTQAWDRLVDVLAKKSHIVDDGELAVKLRLQVGELWEERLGDNERAIEALKEVLTVDAQNMAALKALERLYERTGKMEAYLDIIEHQLEVTGSEEERITLYNRMATVWEEQFGKPDRAIECLQKILLVDDRFEEAYRDLDRLYRIERRWDDLVENYRKHIYVAADPAERTGLYLKMGKVFEDELKDPDRAIEAYNDVVSFDPDHVEALRGLARLYEQTEQWERAVEVMQRLLGSLQGAEKVDLNHRLGKIYDEQMRMPEAAEERLLEALAVDATHVPSMLALLNLYRRRGDSLKAAQLMVRAEANTQNLLEKTRLLHEAGKIYLGELGNEDQARELFARTIALDPEHVQAAEPLAELYFKRGEWAPLVPLLEMLTRKADRRNKELYLLHYRLGKALDKLGDGERALKAYKQAYDLESTYLPTLLDRADLLYRREQWDDAFKLYQTVLVHHREAQKDEEIVEIFYRIGRIKLKTGERAKAINMFEKALEIAPGHKPTLDALVDIYAAANDWEAVIRQKRALIAHTKDTDEKLAAQQEIIKIYREKLKNPQKAIAAHLEALEIRPDSREILIDVLDLFTETQQWKKAVEIVLRLATLSQGKVKAKYLEAAGKITSTNLNSPDEAVEYYNQALDEDPDNLKIFERIDKILTAKKDWKNQERNYRKMIKRLGQDVPADKRQTQIALWHALAVIYRDRLKDFRAAAQAFEVCVALDPDTLSRRKLLAELYTAPGVDAHDKALKEYRHIVQKTEDLAGIADHLKVLRRLYSETNQYDRAYCVTGALALLRAADAEELRFYEQYRPKALQKARARLTEEMWQKSIYHPDEDRFISAVLAVVSGAVAGLTAKEHKDYGLRRKDRRDLATDQVLFSRVFNYVSQVLGVVPPEIYLRETVPADMELANTKEKNQLIPSLVIGANLLQGRTDKELAYIVGKRLTLMRADHFVKWRHVVPAVSQLKPVFLAAIKIVQPSIPLPPQLDPVVTQYAPHLAQQLGPAGIERLAVVVQKFLATKAEADLNRWSVAVDYTATRAGFLMCNDLDVAVRLAQGEPLEVGSPEPKDRVRDLVLWSISDEYFALREQLGLTIG